jgi:hypothetical protein
VRRALRFIGVAIAASIFLLPAIASSAGTVSQKKLSSELLTTAQMPAGWTVANPGTSDGVGCVHELLEPSGVTQTHSAEVYFIGTVDKLPKFDEKIATYSNVKRAYDKIIARIDACHTLTGTFDGLKVTGTVVPAAFSRFGNASAAYAMTISDLRGTLHYYYLITRKDSVLGAFLEGSYPVVIPKEFQSLVSAGVKRLT